MNKKDAKNLSFIPETQTREEQIDRWVKHKCTIDRSSEDYCILVCLDMQYIYFTIKGMNDSSEACVLVLPSIYVYI